MRKWFLYITRVKLRAWFGRHTKVTPHIAILKMYDRHYVLTPGDTFNVKPKITLEGDVVGTLNGMNIPIEVVSID